MAPGAKFRCQKCSTINIVPAAEEPALEEAPPPPPPPRPRRGEAEGGQSRPPVKTSARPAPALSRISGSRVPPSRVSASLKKGRPSPGASGEDEEGEMNSKKSGILAPENRKYIYIGGAILLVLVAAFYVMHSRSVYEKNKKIGEEATRASNEINVFVATKDFVQALEKSEAFIREFKEYDLPEVKKNVERAELSIKGIEQSIEREKEGTARLKELLDKKESATPDQYEDLLKEFGKFITKYAEFGRLFEKASAAAKDLEAKIAAKQEEEDTKIYSELMAEIKPMVDGGRIDEAIAHLKKYWDNTPKISKRVQGALKKKMSELKSMK